MLTEKHRNIETQMRRKEEYTNTSLPIKSDLKRKVDIEAARRGCSKTEVYNDALTEYFKRPKQTSALVVVQEE